MVRERREEETMEEAKAMAQQQQQQHQQLLFQQQQQQQQQRQQQQQFLLLQQQLQKQQHLQQQSSAISRFPSNIDAHLRPLRPPAPAPPPPSSSLSASPNPNPNPIPNNPQSQLHHQRPAPARGTNHTEVQMAYQDAWRVSHPDFKRPFSSLLDACDRLLPYHVVADYEAEEDDRILDSDTTGQMPSRSQQWDHNISAKVAEFTATFEKQALAFNIISRKRAHGEFRSEERMMVEQAMCQEEKRAHMELKAELESREKRMAALEQARAAAEMMSRPTAGPIRAGALGAADISMAHHQQQQQHNHSHNNHLGEAEEMMNGWGQRDEKEPSEDFLNDEETDNGETSGQDGWRETGEFDLNTR